MLTQSIERPGLMHIVKIILLCALSICASATLLQKQGQTNDRMNLGHLLKSIPTKVSFKDVRTISSRLPRAIGRTIKLSTKSFITSSAVLFPVGLVLNINRPRPVDAWLMRGAATGLEWAKVGAYFAVRLPVLPNVAHIFCYLDFFVTLGRGNVLRDDAQQGRQTERLPGLWRHLRTSAIPRT
jgi:hypothetical protein